MKKQEKKTLLNGPGLSPIKEFCQEQLTIKNWIKKNLFKNKTQETIKKRKKILNDFCVFYFIFCWIFIGTVSSIDTCLTVKLRDVLNFHEINPMARMILANDGWEVARFIGLKVFGTILVLGITVLIFLKNKFYGLLIITGLAIFQTFLLLYLLL